MSDDLRQIAKYALRDRQDRVDAGKLAVFAQCMDRIEELEAKLTVAMVGLVQSRDELDLYSQHEYPSDHPVHERFRKRDYDANPARIAIAQIKGEQP